MPSSLFFAARLAVFEEVRAKGADAIELLVALTFLTP
jgi:hypothetical protein